MVQWRFVAARYQRKHTDQCPKLTPGHRCRSRTLADRPQNWNHQHLSHAILDDESRVSLYHSGRRAHNSHLFLGCNNPVAFQQHDDKLGHAHHSCTGWLLIHHQIAHEIGADGSSFGACMPTCCVGSDGQESVWGISLGVFSDVQLLLYILGQAGYWLAWLPIWFKMVICIQWRVTVECDQHKRAKLLWDNRGNHHSRERRLARTGQTWCWQ